MGIAAMAPELVNGAGWMSKKQALFAVMFYFLVGFSRIWWDKFRPGNPFSKFQFHADLSP
jgi:hypothetical protein